MVKYAYSKIINIPKTEHTELIENYTKKGRQIKMRVNEIKIMSIDEFYRNLVEINDINKLINFRIKKWDIEDETHAETEIETINNF